ncbi:MAG: hypothetical protein LBQ31_10275 [Bacteroidales bacterium]|nr:hypothetical protein [Bacteroidales bacterium]
MGVPPPPRRLGRGVGLSAAKSRVSEGRERACADYAERERLHCEAIIFCLKDSRRHHLTEDTNSLSPASFILRKRISAAIPNAATRIIRAPAPTKPHVYLGEVGYAK